MDKPKILFSIPTKHHVEIAVDELEGLKHLGYDCEQFAYAAKGGVNSSLGRIIVIIKNALNLVKIANEFRPDIIYFNSRVETLAGIRDFITILMVKMLCPRKLIFIIKSHGSDLDVLSDPKGVMKNMILPFLKRNISAWLFLSEEEKAEVQNIDFFDEKRIFVTKNIVRKEQFIVDPEFKEQLNIKVESRILLFVGRLIKEKGIYEVMEAFERMRKEQELTLVIVGDGNEYEPLQQLVKTKDLKSVVFTGFIPEQEVVNYYANADILVFPTYFPEGFPMALFNAVAAGLSIITTPIRAAKDYLTEPQHCIWVEARNSESVFKALSKLLQDNELMMSMSANNEIKADEFGIDKVSEELAQIIQTIISYETPD